MKKKVLNDKQLKAKMEYEQAVAEYDEFAPMSNYARNATENHIRQLEIRFKKSLKNK